jgi:Pentapeptide repeats (8 copies)
MAREGQITDRFTKAIAQLGDEKIAVRIGGIYALDRIAKDSEKDHWPVMEVLTAYIRENARKQAELPKDIPAEQDHLSPPGTVQGRWPRLATDIQAVLTVLGRRDRTYEKEDQCLYLNGMDLRGAHLRGAHLERACFWGTHLDTADLEQAHLERADLGIASLQGAHLGCAHLEGAYLWSADLKGAILDGAYLEGAILVNASLQRATLEGAHLEGANLEDANLERARLKGALNLTVEQLCIVGILYQAELDLPLMERVRQQCPELLEKPPE